MSLIINPLIRTGDKKIYLLLNTFYDSVTFSIMIFEAMKRQCLFRVTLRNFIDDPDMIECVFVSISKS